MRVDDLTDNCHQQHSNCGISPSTGRCQWNDTQDYNHCLYNANTLLYSDIKLPNHEFSEYTDLDNALVVNSSIYQRIPHESHEDDEKEEEGNSKAPVINTSTHAILILTGFILYLFS